MYPNDDAAEHIHQVVMTKLAQLDTPGLEIEFDPDEADLAGAFDEPAITYLDAQLSAADLADAQRPDDEGDEFVR